MPTITVRNIPDCVYCALRVRAAQHGRSMEAELRTILEKYLRDEVGHSMGAALSEIWGDNGLTKAEAELIDGARDSRTATPMPID